MATEIFNIPAADPCDIGDWAGLEEEACASFNKLLVALNEAGQFPTAEDADEAQAEAFDWFCGNAEPHLSTEDIESYAEGL